MWVRRVRRERPVKEEPEVDDGVDVPFVPGAEAAGPGTRVRTVRRRELGVSVMWGERLGYRGKLRSYYNEGDK